MASIVSCFEGLGCSAKAAVAGAVVVDLTAGADGAAKISAEVEAETAADVDAAC